MPSRTRPAGRAGTRSGGGAALEQFAAALEKRGEQFAQPAAMTDAGLELAAELIAYCREHLAGYKSPRSVDFRAELPRHPTGKLLKRVLRDEYAAAFAHNEQEISR